MSNSTFIKNVDLPASAWNTEATASEVIDNNNNNTLVDDSVVLRKRKPILKYVDFNVPDFSFNLFSSDTLFEPKIRKRLIPSVDDDALKEKFEQISISDDSIILSRRRKIFRKNDDLPVTAWNTEATASEVTDNNNTLVDDSVVLRKKKSRLKTVDFSVPDFSSNSLLSETILELKTRKRLITKIDDESLVRKFETSSESDGSSGSVRNIPDSNASGSVVDNENKTYSNGGIKRNKTFNENTSVSLVQKIFGKEKSTIVSTPSKTTCTKTRAKSKRWNRGTKFPNDSSDEETSENAVPVQKLPKKPNFPRFHSHCNERFYKNLIKKMEPKYGIKTNREVVNLAKYIFEVVAEVESTNDKEKYFPKVRELKSTLARKQVVVTHHEFYCFCQLYLPHRFIPKAVPILSYPGRAEFDPDTAFHPILPVQK